MFLTGHRCAGSGFGGPWSRGPGARGPVVRELVVPWSRTRGPRVVASELSCLGPLCNGVMQGYVGRGCKDDDHGPKPTKYKTFVLLES